MNNELFKRRLERAFERRAKEKQQLSSVQHVKNVVSDDSGIVITTNINKCTTANIGADNAITSLDRDEQYRATIIEQMINHIHSKRNQNND